MQANRKHIILWLWLMLMCMATGTMAEGINRLYIPNVQTNAGKTVTLPVYMSNTDDIVALEFTLTLPDAQAALLAANSAFSDRATDHQLEIKKLAGTTYKVTGYSMNNSAILGQSGKLINLSLSVPSAWASGSTKGLVMSDVVLAKRDGTNVMTGSDGGAIQITTGDHADIVVSDISLTGSTQVVPGGEMTVNWTVRNQGEAQAEGGWAELVTLTDEYGSSFSFDRQFHTTPLSAGGNVAKSVTFKVPAGCGIEGRFNVRVELIPQSRLNELEADQGNNTMTTSGFPGTMGKLLTLTMPGKAVAENAGAAECSVTRSGNRSRPEIVTLSSGNTTRLSVPSTVTIPVGASTVKWNATPVNDNLWNKNIDVTVTAKLDGYADATGTFSITDDETATLTISTDKDSYTEGETVHLTVTATAANENDVTLMIGTTPSGKIQCQPQVTLPAGATTVTVDAEISENQTVEPSYEARFTANAVNYTAVEKKVTVDDNDTPELQLTLQPSTVHESDGSQCVLATLTRTSNIDKAVNVKLQDMSGGQVIYSATQIGMPAGLASQTFWLGVVDNTNVDGNRTYNIRAAVIFPTTRTTAGVGKTGYADAELTVVDDDSPTLKLGIDNKNIKENSTATLTVTRNTATSDALVVNLSSDHSSLMTLPATVTIPAGKSSATATVSVPEDKTNSANVDVTFSATASGFNPSTCYATIVNQTLPDISDLGISTQSDQLPCNAPATAHVTLKNSGTATLEAGTKVYALISSSGAYAKSRCSVIGETTLSEALAAGESKELDITVDIPKLSGRYYLYALAEAAQGVNEISESNNVSRPYAVTLKPSFTVKVSVDKEVVTAGDDVIITGVASGASALSDEVYMMYEWNGNVYKKHVVETDANGRFTLQYAIPKTQPGNYRFMACHITENTAAPENACSLRAKGWAVDKTTFLSRAMEINSEYKGAIKLTNKSAEPISGVTLTNTEVPEGISLVWADCPATIAGNQTVEVHYTVTPTIITDGTVKLGAVLKADGYNDIKLTGAIATYNPYPNLESNTKSINTTATKKRQKTVNLTIGNMGNGATGQITLSLPAFMKALSGSTIPSLAYGESATICLGITPDSNTSVDTKLTGQIGINCQNGNGVAIPYTVQVVSEEEGTLHIDVCDEYTYYNEGAPQVTGATVEIRNYNTGVLLHTILTNEKGIVEQKLIEGHYKIRVTAAGHESYSGTIVIDADKTTYKTVNLSIVDDIKVKYEIVDTEVEDVYEIVTTTTFETAVPKPQVTFSTPGRLETDALEMGQSLIYTVTVTNSGLVTAKNVTVSKPMVENEMDFGETMRELADFDVEYLTDHVFDLRPKETVVVTYRVTRTGASELDGCIAHVFGTYEYNCGTSVKTNKWQGAILISQACKEDIFGNLDKFNRDIDVERILKEAENQDDQKNIILELPEYDIDVYDHTISEEAPKEDVKDDKGIVIAKVQLQFNQRMTMTRQAFRGTLTIENNSGGEMKDIVLSLFERNMDGVMATSHEFQVDNESINGFGGTLNGPWTLASKSKGTATILYIPTKYAAPYAPAEYTFGGQLTFKDPTTGNTRVRDLTEQVLTVKPSPNLDLTYFMQRDVLGDDALTPEVEPMEEAEFSLIINNVGYGDATNVNMVTEQPQIVDNQQGLLIDFEITRALLNGREETLAMGGEVVTPFGTIPAQGQTYAQWFFTSTLMGHFTQYKVEATHVTSHDNPDLTLLNEVTIHELIHSVDVPGQQGMKGFLCNDEDDDANLPDAIYLTDGTKQAVGIADEISVNEGSDHNSVIVTVKPMSLSLHGWCYGKVRDPKNGKAKIIKVERLGSNAAELSLRNAWITHATMRDGNVPLYENMLHIADCIGADETSYRITYEDRPETELQVKSFAGVPDNGTYVTNKVNNVQVTFNKEINPATFTADDLTLMVQGNKVSCANAVITPVEGQENTYNINLANVPRADGLYVLTVQTKTINDTEGFYGADGSQCSWNEITGEKVELKTVMKREGFGKIPDDACAITLADGTALSDSYDFNTEVTLKATPAYGYIFERWAINGTTLSTEPTFTYKLTSAKDLQLWIRPMKFELTIEASELQGDVSIGSGQYEYGDELEITATPRQGYRLEGWYEEMETIAGNVRARRAAQPRTATKIGETLTINYTVKGAASVYPVFTEDVTPGDVNGDGKVNIQDVQLVIQYSNTGSGNINMNAADMNNDGKINIQDIQMIIQESNNN